MTQFQFDPNIVPPKFVDGQGNLNVQALVQSAGHLGVNAAEHINPQTGQLDINKLSLAYREKEAAQAASTQVKAQPTQTAVIDVKEPENARQVEWDKVQVGPDGKIPPAQRQALMSAGVPTNVIDGFETGQTAIRENNIRRLADVLPGGMEMYNKVIAWVNTALPVQERQRMAAALGGPAGDMALMGYFQQFVAANPGVLGDAGSGGEPNLGNIDTSGAGGTGPVNTGGGNEPFMNQSERHAAFNDVRYGRDKAFTDLVNDRARATSAQVVELQKVNPSKNWVPPTRRGFK